MRTIAGFLEDDFAWIWSPDGQEDQLVLYFDKRNFTLSPDIQPAGVPLPLNYVKVGEFRGRIRIEFRGCKKPWSWDPPTGALVEVWRGGKTGLTLTWKKEER